MDTFTGGWDGDYANPSAPALVDGMSHEPKRVAVGPVLIKPV